MPVWIDAPGAPVRPYNNNNDPFGPFDGALICMNIGKDNHRRLNLPRPYEESLLEAMRKALASGWVVINAFDYSVGIDVPPEPWPYVEGATHFRLMNDICGRQMADFALLPNPRMEEFRAMFTRLRSHKAFKIEGQNNQTIVGSCRIDNFPLLLPLTSVV